MTLNGTLDNRTIAEHLETADREMERRGVESDDRLRFRLSLEEVLLGAQEAFGTETQFHLDMRREKGPTIPWTDQKDKKIKKRKIK